MLQLAAAILVCLTTVITVHGQQSAPTQTPSPAKTVTIVGCLIQGDPTAERGSSPAGAANSADFFVRTPTVAVPVGTTVAVGKPGTPGTTTSTGTPTTDSFYRITGLNPEQLRPHVGHRVELQGELTSDETSTSGKTTAKTTVDATGRATTTVETRPVIAGSLRTTTIKMLSASCP